MAPHTPQRSERPGKPVALLDHTACLAWGPRHGPPYPPTLGAPRGTRGAPRSHRLLSMGAPTWPPIPPNARSAPGEPVALLDHTACLAWGPRHGPPYPPYPPTLGAPRETRGAPRSHCVDRHRRQALT